MSKFKDIENETLEELYHLVLMPEITDFERQKLLIAKNLLEKGSYLPNVLRRLQITFVGKKMSPEVEQFYGKLPEYLKKVQILGTAFMGASLPL